MFDEFSRLMIEMPELDGVIFAKDPVAKMDAELKARADWALAIRFDWFESIVIQRQQYKAIPKSVYDHWLGVLKTELKYPTISEFWESHRTYYHSALRREVERLTH